MPVCSKSMPPADGKSIWNTVATPAEEKILQEVMSSLITFGFDNAAYADLQTEKVRLVKTRPEALAQPAESCLFQDISLMSNGVYIAELDSKRYTRVDTLSPLGPISTSYMPISWDNGDTA